MIQSGQPYMSRVWRAVKERRTYPGLIGLMESAPLVDFTPEEAAVFREAYDEALTIALALLDGWDGKGAVPGTAHEEHQEPTGSTAAAAPSRVPAPPASARILRDDVLDALAAGPMRTREIRKAVGVGTEGGPPPGPWTTRSPSSRRPVSSPASDTACGPAPTSPTRPDPAPLAGPLTRRTTAAGARPLSARRTL
ncbi:hypothetical protein ACPCSD_33975 [Streptomyces griseoincarnatus]